MVTKSKVSNAVAGVVGSVVDMSSPEIDLGWLDVPLVNQFDDVMALQLADITTSAELLVSVEQLEGDTADKKAGLSSLLYGVLISQGEPVTFAWFELVRVTWQGIYLSAKGGKLSDNALEVAWSRVLKLVSDDYGLTKPKAETADAKKKAEQREVKAQELKELVASYEAVPIDDIKSEIKALFNVVADGGDAGKVAKKEADKLVKVVEKLTKSESEELKAEQKAVKDKIKELLKNVSDIYVLRDVMDMLQGAVYDVENLL